MNPLISPSRSNRLGNTQRAAFAPLCRFRPELLSLASARAARDNTPNQQTLAAWAAVGLRREGGHLTGLSLVLARRRHRPCSAKGGYEL
jgi:hypothetical protein